MHLNLTKMRKPTSHKILGIDFINADVQTIIERLKLGGLLVVPAAPALIAIQKDNDYYKSLLEADIVIADSGYMVLLWNLVHRQKIRRISGLELLTALLSDYGIKQSSDFLLVDPKPEEAKSNIDYLNKLGFKLDASNSYLAPFYSKTKVVDPELLSLIAQRRPGYIIINLGGGVQEKLGAFLKRNLSYKPAIICTGAAIAFLTGQQAHIPNWADRLFLGWLFRCIEKPKVYIPRYMKAIKLLGLILRHGRNAPV